MASDGDEGVFLAGGALTKIEFAKHSERGAFQALDDYATMFFEEGRVGEDGQKVRCLGSVIHRMFVDGGLDAKAKDRFLLHVVYPLARGRMPSSYDGDASDVDPENIEAEGGWRAAAFLLQRAFPDNKALQAIFSTPAAGDFVAFDAPLGEMSTASFVPAKAAPAKT